MMARVDREMEGETLPDNESYTLSSSLKGVIHDHRTRRGTKDHAGVVSWLFSAWTTGSS